MNQVREERPAKLAEWLGLWIEHRVVYQDEVKDITERFVSKHVGHQKGVQAALKAVREDAVNYAKTFKERDSHHLNELLISISSKHGPNDRDKQVWLMSRVNAVVTTPDENLLAPKVRDRVRAMIAGQPRLGLQADVKTYFYDQYFLDLGEQATVEVKDGMSVPELKKLLASIPDTMSDGRFVIVKTLKDLVP